MMKDKQANVAIQAWTAFNLFVLDIKLICKASEDLLDCSYFYLGFNFLHKVCNQDGLCLCMLKHD